MINVVCLLLYSVFACSAANSLHSRENPINRNLFDLRSLGDFDELNQLVKDVFIRVKEVSAGRGGVSVTIKDSTVCSDFNLQDLRLTSVKPSSSRTTVQLELEGLDFRCYLDYKYTFLFTRHGTATLKSFDNAATLSFEISNQKGGSNIFQHEELAHSSVWMNQCNPQVRITDLEVDGSISAFVVDLVLDLLRERMEEAAADLICNELEQLTTEKATGWLQTFDQFLTRYLPAEPVNMLASEEVFQVPSSIELMDFLADGMAMRQWVQQLLKEAIEYATAPGIDPVTGNDDININMLIRKRILGYQENYRIDLEDGGIQIFKGHDRLTESIVNLDGITIFGLDTVKELDSLIAVGKHTLESKLVVENIQVELDVSIAVNPSTRSDSLIFNPSSSNVFHEHVKIKFGIENVDVEASFLLGVDMEKLGALQLGSLLNTDLILPCCLSTLFAFEVGGLSVKLDDIRPPTLDGFVSRGIDRFVSSSVHTAFLAYEKTLLEAMPLFCHLTVREFINRIIATQLKSERKCPSTNSSLSESDFVDFRDLLLPSDEAKAAGGSGLQPYGDLIQKLVSKLKDEWFSDDLDGYPKINNAIRSVIAKQTASNDATLLLGDIFTTESEVAIAGLQASLHASILDARIENLDTFGNPLKIIDPVDDEPNILNTSVYIGIGSQVLRFACSLLLKISDGKGLSFENKVAITLDLDSAQVLLETLIQILEKPFFSVPLRDTINVNCWIATILPSSSSSNATGIQVLRKEVNVESLFVNFSCVSCSSPDFDTLMYEIYSPDQSGNVTSQFLNVVPKLQESDYFEGLNYGIVEKAAKQCPHSSKYEPGASYRDLFKSGAAGSVVIEPQRDKRAHFFNLANTLVAMCLTLLYISVRRILYKRYLKWKDSIPPELLDEIRLEANEHREKDKLLSTNTSSMYQSKSLQPWVRAGFPFALVMTLAMQLCGHLAVLSTVNLSGQLAGESFFVGSFLEFSFLDGLQKTAKNGGVEMALLAFLFTGIWPYVKLAVSLCLWFAPPAKLSVSRRGHILIWLDVFAKLSVVDILTLLLIVGVMLIYVGGRSEPLESNEQSFTIKCLVQPGLGFYTIIMAQRILRVSSRYMLLCHETIVSEAMWECSNRRLNLGPAVSTTSLNTNGSDDTDESSDDNDNQESDSGKIVETEDSLPLVPNENEGDEIQPPSTIGVKPVRLLTLLAVATLILIGMIGALLAPSIAIDTKTIWHIVASGRTYKEAVDALPVFRVITGILLQSRVALDSVKDYVGLGFLLALTIVATTAFPFLRAFRKLRQWARQRKVSTESFRDGLSVRASLHRSLSSGVESVKSKLRQWRSSWRFSFHSLNTSTLSNGTSLLPLYRLRAWQQMDVYLSAFVVACWQLGAVAAYTIHLYCYLLGKVYRSIENLGLVETSETECFRVQVSESSTTAVICLGFLALLTSFLYQATSHYRKILASNSNVLLGSESE